MLYSGIDIHPKVSHCVVGTTEGKIIKEEKIKSDKKEIDEFFSGLGKVKVVFEATTIYAHKQASGLVNDHVVNCFRYKKLI